MRLSPHAPSNAKSAGTNTIRPTMTLAQAVIRAAPAAQSFARLASGWISGEAASTIASIAVLTVSMASCTPTHTATAAHPHAGAPQSAHAAKNHNRRHDIDPEVALASCLNHARSRIAERLHEVVLALQRLARLTRINAFGLEVSLPTMSLFPGASEFERCSIIVRTPPNRLRRCPSAER